MRRHRRFTPGLTTDDARLTEKRGWLLFSFRGRKEGEVLIQGFPTLLGQPLRPSRQRSAVAAYFRDHGDFQATLDLQSLRALPDLDLSVLN